MVKIFGFSGMLIPVLSGQKASLFICLALLSFQYSCASDVGLPDLVLVASTPGDDEMKTMLGLSVDEEIDFIRWRLVLNENQKSFQLKIRYGLSKPNTLEFKAGGTQKVYEGSYVEDEQPNQLGLSHIYKLSSRDLPKGLNVAEISKNVYHLLDANYRLKIGNGGWSYVLNAEKTQVENAYHILSNPLPMQSDSLVFVGRTPCQEFAADHSEMQVSEACFKLKWKLVLYKPTKEGEPASCLIRKIVDGKPGNVHGNWSKLGNIYSIGLGQGGDTIRLLAADQRILYFLDAKDEIYPGNKDFSYALNLDAK